MRLVLIKSLKGGVIKRILICFIVSLLIQAALTGLRRSVNLFVSERLTLICYVHSLNNCEDTLLNSVTVLAFTL